MSGRLSVFAAWLLLSFVASGCAFEGEVVPEPNTGELAFVAGGIQADDTVPTDESASALGNAVDEALAQEEEGRPLSVDLPEEPPQETEEKGGDVPPGPAAQIKFVSPGDKCSNPVTMQVSTAGPINHVRYLVDGIVLGISEDKANGFPLVHNFWGTGLRQLEARGYNAGDVQLATTKLMILVEKAKAEEPPKEEPPKEDPPKEEPPQEQPVTIKFLTPVNGGTVWGATTFSVSASANVTYVEYWIDGNAKLGASTTTAGGFPVVWQPWPEGQRVVKAKAFVSGAVKAEDTITIKVQEPEAPEQPQPEEPPPGCPSGQMEDCNGLCVKSSWLDDNICDNGTQYQADFYCAEFDFDGGDCAPACPSGKIEDCNGLCVKSAWLDDNICDNGTQYAADFYCAEFDFDGGDCDQGQVNPGNSGGVPDVPYFYQYNNSLHPGSSCQNTSIAMLLAWYGWNGNPDTITNEWGKNYAQSPAGLAAVFNSYAQSTGIPQRLVPHTDGTIGEMKSMLAAGKPVIIHGYFTSYGHVMVTLAYSSGSYVVNDPAGEWSQTFKGGYPYGGGSTVGDHISYGASAFEAAVATSDGYSYLPLWYHEITD